MNDRRSNLGVTTSARGQPRRLCEKLPADRGFNASFEFDCTERGRGEYASIVTESSSHLGEAFVRRLSQGGHAVLGLDIREGRLTTRVGSITDRSCISRCRSASRRSSTRRPCTGRTSTLIADWPSSTPTLPARSICWKLARRQTSSHLSSRARRASSGDAPAPPVGAPAVWMTDEIKPIPKRGLPIGLRRRIWCLSIRSMTRGALSTTVRERCGTGIIAAAEI
jgi:hypothetical protein